MRWANAWRPFIESMSRGEQSEPRKRLAVLGADSFIGSRVLEQWLGRGLDCVGTTRRLSRVGGRLLHLDLQQEATWHGVLDAAPEVALAFFAVSKLDQCESDPTSAHLNATLVPDLLATLVARGCRVIFLSTNSIFGGERELCGEGDTVDPRIAYSRQKHQAELRLQALVGNASHAVVRITRTISDALPPFEGWLAGLRAGERVEAFDDFVFAPMTPAYVGEGLLQIALSSHNGVFHLSGTDVTYFDLAREIASQLGLGSEAVVRTNSVAKGVSLRFRPRYSALGMGRTSGLLGISPQSVPAVAAELIAASAPNGSRVDSQRV